MDLRQLECLVAVAEEQHFGRAAERLFLGQPAVSQQVRRLERELRVTLFDRTSRHVRITPAGEQLLGKARRVLAAVDETYAAAARLARPGVRTLRVGTCSGLSDHLRRVLAALPADLEVELVPAAARDRNRQVASGRLHAAFTHEVAPHAGLRAVQVWSDPLRIVIPARHPVASRRPLRLADLADLPLRIVSRRANPLLHDLVIGTCVAAGFTPVLGPVSGQLDDTLAAIGSGAPSWTVVYASRAARIKTRTEVFRPFPRPGLSVTTSLLVPVDPGPDVRDLIAACS